MKTHRSLLRCLHVFCIVTWSSVTFGSWLFSCLISARLLSVLILIHFSESTLGAWCLCNHRRAHGTDGLSVQGQWLLACAPVLSATDLKTETWIFSVLQRFYESGCCTEPTDTERNHVSRFHTRPAAGATTPALSTRKHVRAPCSKVTIICCFFYYSVYFKREFGELKPMGLQRLSVCH